MTTETLSLTPTSTPAMPPASLNAAYPAREGGSDADRADPSDVHALPDPMTVEVSFMPDGRGPILTPPPRPGTKSSEKGYQFAKGQPCATLIFEIAPADRGIYTFSGCSILPAPDGDGGDFPMPQGCSYVIQNPFTLVIELAFTPNRMEQIRIEPEYRDKRGVAFSFDPQVGNDGGNIAPPRHASEDRAG